MNKKNFIVDSILNIISTALPLIVLQLISFPVIAQYVGAEHYGIIVTIISALTVISFPIGNVLNNVRLLRDDTYSKENIKGDFNFILLGTSLLCGIILFGSLLMFFRELSFLSLLFIICIVLLSIIREYLIVSYRIILNFKGILFNNLLLSAGYLIGTWLFRQYHFWELIYIIGLSFSFIYLLCTTNLLREPLSRTGLFKKTFSDFSILYGSSLLKNFLTYADKIILLPLLGPKNVAIYYGASIIGKMMSMIFNPVNSVILSYIAKMDKFSRKLFLKACSIIFFLGLIGYFVTVFISPYFLNFFYPTWADESLKLVSITSATAIIGVFISIFHPFNLRYNSIKWQAYMSGSNLLFYILMAYYLTDKFGLIGFTVAVLISELYRLIFQVYVYVSNQKRSPSEISAQDKTAL